MTTQDLDRCSSRGCTRIITGHTVVVDRNGRKYCRKHGDHLPSYLRRTRRTTKERKATTR